MATIIEVRKGAVSFEVGKRGVVEIVREDKNFVVIAETVATDKKKASRFVLARLPAHNSSIRSASQPQSIQELDEMKRILADKDKKIEKLEREQEAQNTTKQEKPKPKPAKASKPKKKKAKSSG